MKQGQGIRFSFESALIDERHVLAAGKRLLPELKAMRTAMRKGYESEYASLSLPSDTVALRQAKALAAKYRDVGLVIVVGIGGSNLGTVAVQEALLGRLHNEVAKPRVFYADTVDSRTVGTINALLESSLRRNERVLINLVTKSGTNTEPVANFQILLATLKRYLPGYASTVVVTTDKGSPLWAIAEQEGFAMLPIPRMVGGRYSGLSPVCLFPLAVLGVDVEELLQGATAMRERCLATDVASSPAATGAVIQYLHNKAGRNISDLFLFASDFESVGKWWRQLLAESCGKEFDRSGKKQVWAGITPMVSIGSTDLHSVAQLGFGGPQDKLTTFVTIEDASDNGFIVPALKEYESLVSHLQGKSLNQIMAAIQQGTMVAYGEGKRPYLHIEFPSRSAYCLGQFLQLKMIETMLLASLLGVNPFDQPAVEQYKAETRRLLAGK